MSNDCLRVFFGISKFGVTVMDAYRLKMQGRGKLRFLPGGGGGSRLSGQNCQRSPLFWVLLHFYKQVFWKVAWEGGSLNSFPCGWSQPKIFLTPQTIRHFSDFLVAINDVNKKYAFQIIRHFWINTHFSFQISVNQQSVISFNKQ